MNVSFGLVKNRSKKKEYLIKKSSPKKYSKEKIYDSCSVVDHKLINSCSDKKNICALNKCIPIIKQLSTEQNIYGHVYSIGDSKMVVKVNKVDLGADYVRNEIKNQMLAYKHGLAPKIYDYYVELNKENDGHKYYIVMENLFKKGYKTFEQIFEKEKISANIINNLRKSIIKLNNIGIAHKDLHDQNIFYNKKTKKFKFIDYGASKYFSDKKLSIINERWSTIYGLRLYNGNWDLSNNDYMRLGKNFGLPIWMLMNYFNNDSDKINEYINKVNLKLNNEEVRKIENLVNIKQKLRKIRKNKKEKETFYKTNKKEIAVINGIKDLNNIREYGKLLIYQNE